MVAPWQVGWVQGDHVCLPCTSAVCTPDGLTNFMRDFPMPGPCLSKDIKITPAEGRTTVSFEGKVIASSTRALALDEPGTPLRIYIPREDVAADVLALSATHTSCPYK